MRSRVVCSAMSLFGRTREIALLDAAFADARAGRGSFVWVWGEPGIGKTGLVSAFAERAGRVVWGRAWEGEPTPPGWLVRQILRRLEVDADPFPSSVALAEGVADVLRKVAGDSVLLVVLEDLHAADL